MPDFIQDQSYIVHQAGFEPALWANYSCFAGAIAYHKATVSLEWIPNFSAQKFYAQMIGNRYSYTLGGIFSDWIEVVNQICGKPVFVLPNPSAPHHVFVSDPMGMALGEYKFALFTARLQQICPFLNHIHDVWIGNETPERKFRFAMFCAGLHGLAMKWGCLGDHIHNTWQGGELVGAQKLKTPQRILQDAIANPLSICDQFYTLTVPKPWPRVPGPVWNFFNKIETSDIPNMVTQGSHVMSQWLQTTFLLYESTLCET